MVIRIPTRPKKPCSYSGCPNLVELGHSFCEKHNNKATKQYIRDRGSASQRGYDSRWRKARLRHLREHPFCVECLKENKLTKATVVDHIVPHRGDRILFWNESNWQSLCEHHHNKKTRTQDQYQEYKF